MYIYMRIQSITRENTAQKVHDLLCIPLKCVRPRERVRNTYKYIDVCAYKSITNENTAQKVHDLLYIPLKCVRPTTREREEYV